MAETLSWSMQKVPAGDRGQVLVCKNVDNTIRWKDGERLDYLFEQRRDQSHASSDGKYEAVVTDDRIYSFREIDDRANQTA